MVSRKPVLPDVIGHKAFFLTSAEKNRLKKNYGYQVMLIMFMFLFVITRQWSHLEFFVTVV